MAKEKKGRRWDGKSRVSTELYRRRFNEIFKKEKTTSKNTNKSSNSSQKSGVSTNFHLSEEQKKEIIELDKKIKIAQAELKEREEAEPPINFRINAEIVNGTCPHCKLKTVLVCLWQGNIYRCMGCGYDVEQKVNGKISYIPHVNDPDNFQYRMKVDIDGK
jgi:predicted RNA-binding Zn-ribbon protein involved in translation (DUF1610 family)